MLIPISFEGRSLPTPRQEISCCAVWPCPRGSGGWRCSTPFPWLAFGLGILMTFLIRQRFRNRTNRIHWRQLGVLAEILLLTLVAFLPQQANLLANSLISLACGFQVEAFRKIHGNAIATTMCIGNLRAGIHAAAEFGFSRKRETATGPLPILR